MTRYAPRAADYLRHILDAIDRAIGYTAAFKTPDDFERDAMALDAVVRNLEILGEAAVKLDRVAPAVVAAAGDIPWKHMRTMRNKVIHDYFEVDVGVVWSTVKNDLPRLREQLGRLLDAQDHLTDTQHSNTGGGPEKRR